MANCLPPETASYSMNNPCDFSLCYSLVLPCDAVRDVKWKSTSSIGNIILQTCVTKLHNRLLGALLINYVILGAGSRLIQEGGVVWGI